MRNFRTPKLHVAVCCTLFAAAASVPTRAAAPEKPTAQRMNQQAQAMPVTAGELADHPDRYYGKRVIVTGEVEDVYSRSMFSVDEDKLWSSGRDLLVLNPNAIGRVNEDKTVTVSGVVRPFDHAQINRYIIRHGWQWDLAAVYQTRFSLRPVVIADSILAPGNRELVMSGADVRSSVADYGKPPGVLPTASPTQVLYTTPEYLSQYPERYYGQTVSIIGTPEDTFGTQLFSIDEDRLWSTGEDVLVLARGVDSNWEDLPYVQVQGKVMRFSKDEVQKRIDKDRTVATRFWQDYDNRPVIIADSVRGPEGRNLMEGKKPAQ